MQHREKLRRSGILLCTICLSFIAVPADTSAEDVYVYKVEHVAEFSPQEISFDKLMGYDVARLQDADHLDELGRPMLPVKELRIALPAGMAVKDIELLHTKSIDIPGQYTILPAQSPLKWEMSDAVADFVQPDVEVYESHDLYPPQVVQYIGQTDLAGQSMAVIHICPVQYVPYEKRLLLHTSVHVAVTGTAGYEYGDYLPVRISSVGRVTYEEMLRSMVVNPSDVAVQTSPVHGPIPLMLPPGGPYDHVIITGTEHASDWGRLVEWHTKRGLRDTIVTPDQIYSSYSGADDQEKIRNFVIDAHSTWSTLYFLFAGEHETVPFEYRTYYGGENTPSDQYYADYDDDWTHEVYVGRVSAENSSQINRFIDKVLMYEKDPPVLDYPLNVLLIGMDLDQFTPAEQLKETIDGYIPTRFNVTKVYDSYEENHRTAVLNALNAGQNLVNHADHCNWNVMGTGDFNHGWGIYNADVDNLTNDDKPCVIVSSGCQPNRMDYDDCIAEHFVVYNTSRAGIVFTGNTRDGWYTQGSPNSLSGKLDRLWWRGFFEYNIVNLGQTLVWCKHQFENNTNIQKHCEWTFNLLGEPAMAVWTETPESLLVTHPPRLQLGPSSFAVHVQEAEGGAVSQAFICLWKPGEVYVRAYTDGNGDALLSPSPATSGTTYVTVTKHNYLPYEGFADAGPIDSLWIVGGDGSSGDLAAVQVWLKYEGGGPGDSMSSFDIPLTWDAAVCSLETITVGPDFVDWTDVSRIDNQGTEGPPAVPKVSVSVFTFGPPYAPQAPGGQHLAATLNFRILNTVVPPESTLLDTLMEAFTPPTYLGFSDKNGIIVYTPCFSSDYVRAVEYVCGDCNGDGRVTVADATYLVTFIYREGPDPVGSGDVNLDGRITVADATYLVAFIYRGGAPPCEPPLSLNEGRKE